MVPIMYIVVVVQVVLHVVRFMRPVKVVVLDYFLLLCMEGWVVRIFMVLEFFHPSDRLRIVFGMVWLINRFSLRIAVAMSLHVFISVPKVISRVVTMLIMIVVVIVARVMYCRMCSIVNGMLMVSR